jgi:SSS family solute:Na+ symporter
MGVVAVYLALMIVVGVILRSRVRSVTDYLVAGRKLGIVLTTATLASVQLGAGVIIGGAELGASSGFWPGTWYGLGCGGGLILGGALVAARMRSQGAYVPLDYFGKRYGEIRGVRLWAGLSNIPSLLGVLTAQIMAAGSIFVAFGFTYAQGAWTCGLVIMIYSVLAGMWGTVVTDLIQLAIILVGVPLIAVAAVGRLGEATSVSTLLGGDFVPAGMESQAVFIIVPFLLSISVSYDAFMRFQSAGSAAVARWGAILGGVIVIGVSFCAGLAGAAGGELYAELDAAAVLPHLIQESLPPLAAGLVLSALLAAAMSSGNCLLISLAGCVSRDLYNMVLRPSRELDELPHVKLLARGVTAGGALLATLIALQAKGILYTLIIFNYPYMASMLVPLLGGVLWRGATPRGAMAAMLTGGTVGMLAFGMSFLGPFRGGVEVDLGLLAAYLVSAVTLVVVSLRTAPRRGRS